MHRRLHPHETINYIFEQYGLARTVPQRLQYWLSRRYQQLQMVLILLLSPRLFEILIVTNPSSKVTWSELCEDFLLEILRNLKLFRYSDEPDPNNTHVLKINHNSVKIG